MKLVKYSRPYNVFDTLFDNWTRGLMPTLHGALGVESAEETVQRLPRTNIEEKDDSFVFTMEMPGLAKKDVEVSLENDMLCVNGEKVEKSDEKKDKGFLRREIHSTRFERSFSLGNEVDQDGIKASMADGILTVTLPKKKEKVGRKVDVS